MASIPTVKVESKDSKSGFMIINECDFDPKAHTKWGDKPKAAVKPKPAAKSYKK